jgi:RNA polymerase sigma factor (sigma-70 family)
VQQSAFLDLLRRVRTGCPDAARDLVERFSPHLLAVIRRHRNRQVRPLFDCTDFTQMVWLAFFTRAVHSHTFENPQHLVAFLTSVAHNTVLLTQRQQLRALKRNRTRWRSLNHAAATALPDRQLSPADTVANNDEVDQLMRQQPEPLRRGLQMLREGHSLPDVAQVLQIHERNLRRIIGQIRAQGA